MDFFLLIVLPLNLFTVSVQIEGHYELHAISTAQSYLPFLSLFFFFYAFIRLFPHLQT